MAHSTTLHGVTNVSAGEDRLHRISVVVPVYQGARTLPTLVAELEEYTTPHQTPEGHSYVVSEVLLVHDHGPDSSDVTIRELEEAHSAVRGIWLSRNFGQHPATLAGMASSGGDWIITMDEDGQHDPAAMPTFLDTAMRERADVVYALPTNPPPHSLFRNITSKGSKWLLDKLMGSEDSRRYQSYRMVLGEIGRSVAAYVGSGVYLDVALGWIASKVAQAPVELRSEGDRVSGYRTRTLISHFWRMVLSSGTKGLRAVTIAGAAAAAIGILLALYLFIAWLAGHGASQAGWTSTMVVLLVFAGVLLFFLGIIAEYIGVNVNMAMGKPAYLIVSDPGRGPLGRPAGSPAETTGPAPATPPTPGPAPATAPEPPLPPGATPPPSV